MAKPHPSMALLLDLDERLVDNDLRLEIDRCYSYLGTPVVRTHPAGEGAPENTIRMMVRVGAREYLDSTVEGADALWNDSIEHWLLNQVHAVENQMKIFNRRQREEGRDELFFTWLEVELAGGRLTVRLRLDSSCGIDPADSVWVTRVRAALNEGALGEGVVAVQLPSDASFEQQYVAGMAALAARKVAEGEAARAAEEAAAAEAAEAEAAAEAAFMASPALVAEAEEAAKEAEEAADIVVQARIARDLEAAERGEPEKTPEQIVAERIAEEAHLGEDIQKKYALPEADFPIAFDQWTVIYADGTTRDFDAIRGVLAE
ncbi:hypothetical protein [Adlercreutzia caecimuris]|uniref:hypothetical protein n=1 Tax=Adlercreutzia caecimuris TaxID=671266 RepID=UPI000EEAA6D4|nr:hypothetical protein [Adlercreutzia caecimuris]NBJ66223.1 hypothetical protein [Adlercreutzia caecimuris]